MKIKLEQIRKQRKMSQLQLSKKTGIARSYISEIENGIYKNVGAEIICKLAKALNCTPNDLIDCGGEENGKH